MAKRGRKANPEFSQLFSFRLNREMLGELRQIAEQEHATIADIVRTALQEYLVLHPLDPRGKARAEIRGHVRDIHDGIPNPNCAICSAWWDELQ